MYKIMTKLHTQEESVYRYYMIYDEDNKLIEYATDDLDEVVETALELLRKVGYKDLRIVEDKPYYIEVEKTSDPGVTPLDIKTATELLGIVGYDDLSLNHDANYDLIWNWGERPQPIEDTYILAFINDLKGVWTYSEINEIKAGESRINSLTIEGEYESFHLIVDGYDCREGMPEWIEYIGDLTFRFNNIQADHEIEVIVDRQPEPEPEPGD